MLFCHPLFLCPLYCCDFDFFFCFDELDWLSLDAAKKNNQEYKIKVYYFEKNTSKCVKAAIDFSIVTERKQNTFIEEKKPLIKLLTVTNITFPINN